MKFKSPFGAVDVPELGLTNVETVEATGSHAESLLAQGWTRVDQPKTRKPAAEQTEES